MKSLVSEITSSVNEFNLNIIYMCFFSFIFQKNFYVFKNFKDFFFNNQLKSSDSKNQF